MNFSSKAHSFNGCAFVLNMQRLDLLFFLQIRAYKLYFNSADKTYLQYNLVKNLHNRDCDNKKVQIFWAIKKKETKQTPPAYFSDDRIEYHY